MPTKTVNQCFEELEEIFNKRERWVKYKTAISRKGIPTLPISPLAYKFSLLGAVIHVTHNNDKLRYQMVERLVSVLPESYNTLGDFNNDIGTTHADLLRLVSRAKHANIPAAELR